MRRRRVHLLALHVVVLGVLGFIATPAHAAAPTAVRLSGPGLGDPALVRAADTPELFKDLLAEVDWLANRPGNAPNPDPAGLGPKYELVVFVDDKANQTYDLYPLAVGGPRVFRPAEQPGRKVAAAWLYGRVSMPDTLRQAGVPLVVNDPGTKENTVGGGQGGGTAQGAIGGVGTPTPESGLATVLQEWQQWLLLVGGGALVLLLMLAGVAFLVRKAT